MKIFSQAAGLSRGASTHTTLSGFVVSYELNSEQFQRNVVESTATGSVRLQPTKTAKARPGLRRRIELEATTEGRRVLAEGRKELAGVIAGTERLSLVSLRLAKGLSQSDVAAATGILQPQLSRLENGRHTDPRQTTIQRLAAIYGVDEAVVRRAVEAANKAASFNGGKS